MTNRAILFLVVFILGPLGVATWILGTYTVGESLSPPNATSIGFAVALLVVMTTAYLLLFGTMTEKPGSHLGLALVLCGTACVLLAVVLQFYLASLSAENGRRMADILSEGVRNGHFVSNVNINPGLPSSVQGVGYLALFVGVWLAAVGIRMGVGQVEKTPKPAAKEGFASFSEPAKTNETGNRESKGDGIRIMPSP